MPQRFDPNRLQREIRDAQRRAEADWRRAVSRAEQEAKRLVDAHNREMERHNREVQRRVDDYNRKAEQHNRNVIANHNREVDRVNAHNAAVVAALKNQLRTSSTGPRYTEAEQALADRVQLAVQDQGNRQWDAFLSYARIDGSEVGNELREHLEALGTSVWFDAIAIAPGKSQARQMDRGLQKARAGIALLTPAYLVGRFWTERELGALLHKATLIPVLHGVTFAEVAQYSGILPDLAGFETTRDSVEVIAQKIAAALN